MAKNITHYKFFFSALRTALIFIAGLLTYEFLKKLEIRWNNMYPNNELGHFARRKLYHFITIFLFDLFIVYLILFLFDIHL